MPGNALVVGHAGQCHGMGQCPSNRLGWGYTRWYTREGAHTDGAIRAHPGTLYGYGLVYPYSPIPTATPKPHACLSPGPPAIPPHPGLAGWMRAAPTPPTATRCAGEGFSRSAGFFFSCWLQEKASPAGEGDRLAVSPAGEASTPHVPKRYRSAPDSESIRIDPSPSESIRVQRPTHPNCSGTVVRPRAARP